MDEMEESLRAEFEAEYGRDRSRKDEAGYDYGQWLDMHRLPPDQQGRRQYRSMVTEYAWRAFRHGRTGCSPNAQAGSGSLEKRKAMSAGNAR